MKRAVLIGGFALIALCSIGVLGRRPHGPGPKPTSQPPTAAATPIQRTEPAPASPGGRLYGQRLLRRRVFGELTQLVETRQRRFEESAQDEDALARLLDGFSVADPALQPLLDEWAIAHPDSLAPRLARAHYWVAVGAARRGAKVSRETTPEQFAAMREALSRGVDDARSVLAVNPKLSEAHGVLIAAARFVADPAACIRLAETGLAAVPGSREIRTALAYCLLPRWGGSYEAVSAVAAEAVGHAEQNPTLRVLDGFVAYDRGRVAARDRDFDTALSLYGTALESGEYAPFYLARARVHIWHKHYGDALADLDRALALSPEHPGVLLRRAEALTGLGRDAEALADIRLASELDPTSLDLERFKRFELANAAVQGHQALQANDLDRALRRLTRAIDLTGGDAEVFYWRGRAHLRKRAEASALRDFQAAVEHDPHHFDSYQNLDHLLAKRREWDTIIANWDRFLQYEPENGKAYLERAGAKRRGGDMRAALVDVRKACDLGVQEACGILRRSDG